ncbi:unnamed protein product [Coregonus sp. 'balchen']|nr:unnamed protein product [Coregonus sp. 'balchen']
MSNETAEEMLFSGQDFEDELFVDALMDTAGVGEGGGGGQGEVDDAEENVDDVEELVDDEVEMEGTGAQQYGGQGGEITLTLTISGHIEDILWKHNGNKVVVFDGSKNREYGRYKPTITCVVNNTIPENMDRTLLSSADLQPLTQFIWRSPGRSESPGPELFIKEGSSSVLAVILSILILLVLVAVLILLWRWRKGKKLEGTGAQRYGGQGGEITLTPSMSGYIEYILWKHNGNKVVVFDGSQNREYGRYKHRIILDWHTGELTISGLTDADSGSYLLEAVIKGKLQYSQHEVDVIDVVSQPNITCVVNNTTPENMDRTLLCSADLQPLTQFIWRSPGGSVSPGPELFIPGGENQESVYTCVVKNPVSEKTAEFTLKDCYTEEGSSSVLAVILSILILLVLVAVLVLLWRWRKGKKHTEPVQDKPTPAQSDLVTPDPNLAQPDPVTPVPTPAQTDLITPDPTPAQSDPGTPDPTPAQPDLITPEPAQGKTGSADTTETAPGKTDPITRESKCFLS